MSFLARLASFVTAFIVMFESLGLGNVSQKPTDYTQCKNVIFMIGDGMGFNSINKTKHDLGIEQLNLDTFPIQGESKTASASDIVTDSAAGGSALATGNRIINNTVGVYPYDTENAVSHPMNLCELAVSQGKLAGIVTTDATSGATPAAFSTHTSDRDNEADITAQQLNSDLTLIWGHDTESYTVSEAEANGFITLTSIDDMNALTEGTRSFGQFPDGLWHQNPDEGLPTIAQMTEKAIDLLDDDEDGFFLMVEGAHIDKNNHKNNAEGMEDALLAFDKAVGVALAYAKTHEDTMVVVTADHETGGITLKNGEYVYTETSHTSKNVPLLVYGADIIENGEKIKNKEVSRRVACCMGEESFPIRVQADASPSEKSDWLSILSGAC